MALELVRSATNIYPCTFTAVCEVGRGSQRKRGLAPLFNHGFRVVYLPTCKGRLVPTRYQQKYSCRMSMA